MRTPLSEGFLVFDKGMIVPYSEYRTHQRGKEMNRNQVRRFTASCSRDAIIFEMDGAKWVSITNLLIRAKCNQKILCSKSVQPVVSRNAEYVDVRYRNAKDQRGLRLTPIEQLGEAVEAMSSRSKFLDDGFKAGVVKYQDQCVARRARGLPPKDPDFIRKYIPDISELVAKEDYPQHDIPTFTAKPSIDIEEPVVPKRKKYDTPLEQAMAELEDMRKAEEHHRRALESFELSAARELAKLESVEADIAKAKDKIIELL